jgi:hypothetical protein
MLHFGDSDTSRYRDALIVHHVYHYKSYYHHYIHLHHYGFFLNLLKSFCASLHVLCCLWHNGPTTTDVQDMDLGEEETLNDTE